MLKRKSNVTVREVPKQRQTTKQEQVVKQTVKVVIGEEKKKKKKRRRRRVRDAPAYQRTVRRANPYNNFYGDPRDGYNVPPRPRAYMTNVGNIPTRVQVNTETGIRLQDANNLGIRRQLEIIRENDRLRAEQLRISKETRDSQVDTFSARSFDDAPSAETPVTQARPISDRPSVDGDSQTTRGVFIPQAGLQTGVGGQVAKSLSSRTSATSSTSSADSMTSQSPVSPPSKKLREEGRKALAESVKMGVEDMAKQKGFKAYSSKGKFAGLYYRVRGGGRKYTQDEVMDFDPAVDFRERVEMRMRRRETDATNPSRIQPRKAKRGVGGGSGSTRRNTEQERELEDILEGLEPDEEVDVTFASDRGEADAGGGEPPRPRLLSPRPRKQKARKADPSADPDDPRQGEGE